MDSNKFDRIDELLESTSAEKRIKFDFSEIEPTESKITIEKEPEDMPVPTIDVTPVEEPVVEEIVEEPVIEEPVFEEVIEDEPEAPAEEPAAPVAAPVLLDPIVDDEPEVQEVKKEKKVKQPKQPKDKASRVKLLQIALIVIVSVATLWTVMYTVDHTLAAQGIGPVFSYNNSEYTVSYINSEEAGAWSYDCLGYKVQFLFDESGQLKQDCVWAWEEGPNDVLLKRGVLFEIGAAE